MNEETTRSRGQSSSTSGMVDCMMHTPTAHPLADLLTMESTTWLYKSSGSVADCKAVDGWRHFRSRTVADTRSVARLGYRGVFDAIYQLHQNEADEWQIEAPVFEAATRFAARLTEREVPPPSVFTHGPESLVLSWENGDSAFYVTINETRTSLMVCAPEGVVRRSVGPNDNLSFNEALVSSLGYSGLLQSTEEVE